jgi:hypothetical protein
MVSSVWAQMALSLHSPVVQTGFLARYRDWKQKTAPR